MNSQQRKDMRKNEQRSTSETLEKKEKNEQRKCDKNEIWKVET